MVVALPLAVVEKTIQFVLLIDDVVDLSAEDIQKEVRTATANLG